MARIVWHGTGDRRYETGVDRGVLFVKGTTGYGEGVAWNGLTAVTQSPSGAEATPHYADNTKYLNLVSAEEFGGTIEAFTYPDEFEACDGSVDIAPGVSIGQQVRSEFGFTYRTKIGNDVNGVNHGYKIHLVYEALAAPSEKAYATINESTEPLTFSWEFTTTPLPVNVAEMPNLNATARLTIDSTKVEPTALSALEALLYGDETSEPELPTPDEVFTLFSA